MRVVGLDLKEEVFSHGQLYVGCSRAGNKQNLYLQCPINGTKNIVYKSKLNQINIEGMRMIFVISVQAHFYTIFYCMVLHDDVL